MNVSKLQNLDGPVGLYLVLEKSVKLSNDSNDFTLIQKSSKFSLNIEMVSDKIFKLLFTESTKDLLDLNTESHLIWILQDEFGEDYQGEKAFVFDLLPGDLVASGSGSCSPDFEKNEGDEYISESCPVEVTSDCSYDIITRTDSIVLKISDDLLSVFNDSSDTMEVIIESYDFNDYAEFVTKETVYTFTDGVLSGNKFTIEHDFENNMIHRVFVEYFNPLLVPSNIDKRIEVILGRPEFYFATSQYINQTLIDLELDIELLEDNDLKKLIWRQSRLAYLKSGLHINDLNTLDTLEKTLFAEYVTHKILVQKYVSSIYNKYLTGGASSLVPVATSSMTLGDYTTVDGGGINTMETLKSVNNTLNELTIELKALSNSRGIKSANRANYYLFRQSILPKSLAPLMELKKGEEIPYSRIDYLLMYRQSGAGEIIDQY